MFKSCTLQTSISAASVVTSAYVHIGGFTGGSMMSGPGGSGSGPGRCGSSGLGSGIGGFGWGSCIVVLLPSPRADRMPGFEALFKTTITCTRT
jgi:hypothetical protein